MDLNSGNVFGAYSHYVRSFMSTHGSGTGCRVASFVEWFGGEANVHAMVSTGGFARGLPRPVEKHLCGQEAVVDFVEEAGGARTFVPEVCGQRGDAGAFGETQVECESVSDGFFRGKNWKKNQRKSKARKVKRHVADEGRCSQESGEVGEVVARPKDALRLSLEKKWALENELRAARAARELELLKSEDLGAVKKLRERKVQGATERTMVQIEKAHASLVRSGDVPGVQPGFCQTVVDGEIVESVPGLSDGESKGCSISPSSSISEREVREMKKELEDLKAELKKEKKKNYRKDEALKVLRGEEVAVSVRFGDVAESAKDAFDDVCGKDMWDAAGDLDMDPDTLYVKYEGGEALGGYDYSY